jgi:hypothetical protein
MADFYRLLPPFRPVHFQHHETAGTDNELIFIRRVWVQTPRLKSGVIHIALYQAV